MQINWARGILWYAIDRSLILLLLLLVCLSLSCAASNSWILQRGMCTSSQTTDLHTFRRLLYRCNCLQKGLFAHKDSVSSSLPFVPPISIYQSIFIYIHFWLRRTLPEKGQVSAEFFDNWVLLSLAFSTARGHLCYRSSSPSSATPHWQDASL